MPKDSPCNEGAQRMSAPRRRAATSESLRVPSHLTRSDSGWRRRCTSLCGPSPATHKTAGRSNRANASNRTPKPLRVSWRPRNSTVGRSEGTGSARANLSMSIPLKRTSYSPLLERIAVSRAASETATRTCKREPTRYTNGLSKGTQRLTPARFRQVGS